MFILSISAIIILNYVSINFANNETNCDKIGTLLYEDLKCKPEFDGRNPCPLRYVCDNFDLSNDTCLFQSRNVPIGETIDNDLTYSGCQVGCSCEINHLSKKAQFRCAVLDCPEWLGAYDSQENCHRTYKLGECCSSGQNCALINETAICEVDGTKYKEGERFRPENTCLECICTKDFVKGNFDKTYCQRDNCVVQTVYAEELSKKCAPYFREDIKCCPSTWVCPTSKSNIIVKNNNTTITNSDFQCKFGETGLGKGDKVEMTTEIWGEKTSVTCECILPPLLTCRNSVNKLNAK